MSKKYSADKKLEVLSWHKKNKASLHNTSRVFEIDRKSLREWLKKETSLRASKKGVNVLSPPGRQARLRGAQAKCLSLTQPATMARKSGHQKGVNVLSPPGRQARPRVAHAKCRSLTQPATMATAIARKSGGDSTNQRRKLGRRQKPMSKKYSVDKKLEVLSWHKKNKASLHRTSRVFKIDRKSLREWLKKETALQVQASKEGVNVLSPPGRQARLRGAHAKRPSLTQPATMARKSGGRGDSTNQRRKLGRRQEPMSTKYSVDKKLEVLSWHKKNKASLHETSRVFKIDRKSLREWLRKETALRASKKCTKNEEEVNLGGEEVKRSKFGRRQKPILKKVDQNEKENDMMALSPKQSGELISTLATHVSILKEGVEKVANMIIKALTEETLSIKTYKTHPLHPKEPLSPSTVDWIFLIDTLNFSFWSEPDKGYKVTYQNETYTGYWSLCAAVNRAIDEGYNITSPEYYSSVKMETLQHIFRSDNDVEIPLLKERHRILHETGKCLLEKFDGSFVKCVELCKNNAEKLLKLVVDNFPSYRDEAVFENKKVSFYKRAQILIGDIWSCFEGKEYGLFDDIDSLSMFADYRVPQLLVYLEVLKYSDELQKALEKDDLIENGHIYEVEIRGCTIWAVELICDYIKQKQNAGEISKQLKVNAVLIDYFLWDYRRKYAEDMKHIPFHKTRCIYY